MAARNSSRLSLLSVWVRDHVNGRVFLGALADDLIVGSDQKDDAGGTDRDKRLFFNKTKGSFRAGSVTGTQWDDSNVGTTSAAFGLDTKASGAESLVSGSGGTASAQGSCVLGGGNGTASGLYGVVLGGFTSVASGHYSNARGAMAVASRQSQDAWSANPFAAAGDCQKNTFIASRATTNATPAVLWFDVSGVSANLTGANTNVLTVPVSRAHRFTINAVARRTDSTSDAGGWTITGTIIRGASGNATFISTPSVVSDLTSGAISGAWSLAVTINTGDATNNYLVITATGQASATIRWAADITTTEVG